MVELGTGWCCENQSSPVFKQQPEADKMVPSCETSSEQEVGSLCFQFLLAHLSHQHQVWSGSCQGGDPSDAGSIAHTQQEAFADPSGLVFLVGEFFQLRVGAGVSQVQDHCHQRGEGQHRLTAFEGFFNWEDTSLPAQEHSDPQTWVLNP